MMVIPPSVAATPAIHRSVLIPQVKPGLYLKYMGSLITLVFLCLLDSDSDVSDTCDELISWCYESNDAAHIA